MHGCWKKCARRAATNHRRRLIATAKGLPLLLAGLLLADPAGAQFAPPPAGATQDEAPMTPAPMAPPAETGPVFSQHGIPAEATAADAVQAKELAFIAGRRAAWQALAASAGVPAPNISDAQIENLVSSIIVEQERLTSTRYSGRLTVNFSPARARAVLTGQPQQGTASAQPTTPASLWINVTATYRSLGEWLELRRRLSASAPVASVEVRAIAVDAAQLHLGLRQPPAEAADTLAGLGVALQPGTGMTPGDGWRVGLAGGG
jgi:hypothetical protein